jgi:class 3 adenylate cyclase
MRVEVEPDIEVSAKTVGELRKVTAWPETLAVTTPQESDVVGFSRLTGSDEEGTLARLRTLWSDLIAPTISVHNGRVVKRTGDGSIVTPLPAR